MLLTALFLCLFFLDCWTLQLPETANSALWISAHWGRGVVAALKLPSFLVESNHLVQSDHQILILIMIKDWRPGRPPESRRDGALLEFWGVGRHSWEHKKVIRWYNANLSSFVFSGPKSDRSLPCIVRHYGCYMDLSKLLNGFVKIDMTRSQMLWRV